MNKIKAMGFTTPSILFDDPRTQTTPPNFTSNIYISKDA